MINYLKSEQYRLLHKTGLHLTSIIGLLLIVAAAVVLTYFGQHEPNFLYANSWFFYSNVIAGSLLILLIALLCNSALTGKDMSVMKQSISFGISRSTIFWSKLIVTFSYFLLVCIIGLLLTIVLGETLLAGEGNSVGNYLIACLNMLPHMVSGFFIIHAMRLLKIGDIYIIFLLLFTFSFSGTLLRVLFRSISGLDELYLYAPSTLLNDNLTNFTNQAAIFDYHHWIVGTVISIIALFIGAKRFAKQSID